MEAVNGKDDVVYHKPHDFLLRPCLFSFARSLRPLKSFENKFSNSLPVFAMIPY